MESQSPFCGAVGALAVALFGPWLGGLAFASIVAHVVGRLPTDTGLPLLLPFSGGAGRATCGKNTDTGGAAMYVGTIAALGVDPREAVFAVVAWPTRALV